MEWTRRHIFLHWFLDHQVVSNNVIIHVATAQFVLHFYWDFTDKGKDTWPFNSQKWLARNFSLQYQYIVQQTGDENRQTYQPEGVILI